MVELAASVKKINEGKKQIKMRLLRNICILVAVAAIAFTAAYVNSYKIEPVVEEEPAAQTASEIILVTPSPTVEATTASETSGTVKTGEEYYRQGLVHMKHNRYWSAISAFEEAKKLGYEVKKSDSQIKAARKSLEVQKLNSKAMELYEQKDYEKAINAFAQLAGADAASKGLAQYSDSFFKLAEEHNLTGVEYHNQGKLELSLKEFEAALGMLNRMKAEVQNYDQQKFNDRYVIYTKNKTSLLEKKQKIDDSIKLADQCNRAGVQYFSEGELDKAKHEFEKALEYLGKIRQLTPEYQESGYTSLLMLCQENLKSIEAKLKSE